MRSAMVLFIALAGLAGASYSPAQADEPLAGAAAASRDGRPEKQESSKLPADSTTGFTLNVDGRSLAFHVTAGSLQLKDEAGAPQAVVAYVAYTLDGADPERRPVTFAINGGPGAASAWLHLGALGPWRLPMNGLSPASSPALVDNAETWLDFTDLVFVDPPGTGYSRIVAPGDEARRRFWSVEGDVDGLAATIRRWLAAERRLASPKFIVGESYGGFRGPRLAEALATDQGVGVSGLVLISPALDMAALAAGPDDPFPLLTRLPSYAAAVSQPRRPGLARRPRRGRALRDRRLSRRLAARPRRRRGGRADVAAGRRTDRDRPRRLCAGSAAGSTRRRSCANSSGRRARSSPSTTRRSTPTTRSPPPAAAASTIRSCPVSSRPSPARSSISTSAGSAGRSTTATS